MSLRHRLDLRPQNDPAVKARLRGIHRDMGGNVIGAYTPEGGALGSKKGERGGLRGLAKWEALNGGKPAAGRYDGETTAARPGSKLLKDRKALFADMKQAGRGGISQGLRDRAKGLGVTEKGFSRALAKVDQAPGMLVRPAGVGEAEPKMAKRKPVNPNARPL